MSDLDKVIEAASREIYSLDRTLPPDATIVDGNYQCVGDIASHEDLEAILRKHFVPLIK